MIGNTHAAAEWQCPVRSGQSTIMQGATTGGPCAQFARRIVGCDAAFGARADPMTATSAAAARISAFILCDYSFEVRPPDYWAASATTRIELETLQGADPPVSVHTRKCSFRALRRMTESPRIAPELSEAPGRAPQFEIVARSVA